MFWHGLDRDDLPWDRRVRLALKFELVTMLRSGELLAAHRDELRDLDGEQPRFDVPLKRVKKRRAIQQPLVQLGGGDHREALTSETQQYVFASPLGVGRCSAGHGDGVARQEARSGKVDAGICALLGLRHVHAARSAPHGGDTGRRSRSIA